MINQDVLVCICMRVEGRYELVRSTENKPSVIKLYMPTIYIYIYIHSRTDINKQKSK